MEEKKETTATIPSRTVPAIKHQEWAPPSQGCSLVGLNASEATPTVILQVFPLEPSAKMWNWEWTKGRTKKGGRREKPSRDQKCWVVDWLSKWLSFLLSCFIILAVPSTFLSYSWLPFADDDSTMKGQNDTNTNLESMLSSWKRSVCQNREPIFIFNDF